MTIIRPTARVLLFGPKNDLLLLDACVEEREFWLTPGGGLEGNETVEQAAHREVFEETGLKIELGPKVWTRRHCFTFEGRHYDQRETYFLSRTDIEVVEPRVADPGIRGWRWWSLEALEASTDRFVPTTLVARLPALLRGEIPAEPLDVGV